MTELIEVQLPDYSTSALRDRILQELSQRGLHRPGLVFRGFSREMIGHVLKYGSENPNEYFIYGNPEDHLSIEPDPHWVNPLSYALQGGALAVYDGDKIKPYDYTTYGFPDLQTKQDALVVVFDLNLNR